MRKSCIGFFFIGLRDFIHNVIHCAGFVSNGNHAGMFHFCSNATSFDGTGFNTTNITNMSYMFRGCGALTNINLSNFDTSNVTNMYEIVEKMELARTVVRP